MTHEDMKRTRVTRIFVILNVLLFGFGNISNVLLVQILLYGDKSFTHDQNRKILESTLKFIHSSERFL